MQNSKPNFLGKPVQGKYEIRKKLKAGGFGYVYIGRSLKEPTKDYAIKFMPMTAKKYADIELRLYELFQKNKMTNGFVKYYDNGIFMDHKYLAMQLIGKDLEDIKKQRNHQQLSVKSALMIGLQMVDRLQAIHKIGFIHRDVKPDNMAIGLKQKSKIIYLIDFGLAHPIGSPQAAEEKGKVVGTLGFMSCRSHEGKPQGPADDIQSLIYTLLYLCEGSLPWLKLQIKSQADFHKIFLSKKGLSKKTFKNQIIPDGLFRLLQDIHKTKAQGKIDYLQIKYRLLDCIKKIGENNDFIFDWLSQTERNNEPLSPLKKKKDGSPQQDKRLDKKLQLMNEENQQFVQNQIYQVYKFMEHEGKPKDNRKIQSKIKSPLKKKQLKQQKQRQNQLPKKRPQSAVNKQKKQIVPSQQPWEKLAQFQSISAASGPRIVINKTAKHKI